MPSKNLKQHRLMSMVATDPKAAKRLKIPQSVGAEFMHADKGKKFKEGGEVKKLKSIFKGKDTHSEELKEAKAIKSGKITPAQYAKGEKMEKPEKSEMKKFKDGGKVTPDKYDAEKHKTDDYPQFKKGGVVKKAEGGNLALFGSRKVSEGQGMRPPGSDEVGSSHKARVAKINTPPAKTASSPPPATKAEPKTAPKAVPKAAPKPAAKARPSGETSASKERRMAAYADWKGSSRDPLSAMTQGSPGMKKGGKTKCMQTGGVVPAAVPVRAPVVAPQALPVQQPVVAPRVMKGGGSVTRADGCVSKGHTRGRFI